jgi:hypothetical protein
MYVTIIETEENDDIPIYLEKRPRPPSWVSEKRLVKKQKQNIDSFFDHDLLNIDLF